MPAARPRASGPLGALLSSPALDVRLPTALQVLQVPEDQTPEAQSSQGLTEHSQHCISLPVRTKKTQQLGEATNPHAMARECLPTHTNTHKCVSDRAAMLCANAIAQAAARATPAGTDGRVRTCRCRRIPCNHLWRWRPVYNPNGAEWEMEASQRARLAPTARVRNGRCRCRILGGGPGGHSCLCRFSSD